MSKMTILKILGAVAAIGVIGIFIKTILDKDLFYEEEDLDDDEYEEMYDDEDL